MLRTASDHTTNGTLYFYIHVWPVTLKLLYRVFFAVTMKMCANLAKVFSSGLAVTGLRIRNHSSFVSRDAGVRALPSFLFFSRLAYEL